MGRKRKTITCATQNESPSEKQNTKSPMEKKGMEEKERDEREIDFSIAARMRGNHFCTL